MSPHPVPDKNMTLRIQWGIVVNAMGHGMRLRVPHDLTQSPRMVKDPRHQLYGQTASNMPEFDVPPEIVKELVSNGLIQKLTENRVGDSSSYRLGWREALMDGDVADWYVCMQ